MRACPRCRSAYVSEIEFCGIDGAQLVETDTDPLIGELVDRYEVVELIGRGAMGSVYRARHTVLERDFAMKVLFGDLASNRTFAGRFRREAQALSKLRHTNIISVNDFGSTENGLTFLVMDYVQGTTLAEVIRVDAPLYPFRAARIARQIASALAEAHRAGLIHRDVKPENIFLVSEGDEEVVKLLDFGIVAVDDDVNATKLTGNGRIVGTPTYMAPEQARQGAITPAVDLYALGVILYEMLSGRPPFEGSVAELLVRHALEQPPALPSAGGLEDLVARLLAKSPEARPPTAGAIIAEIDGLVLDWSGVSNVTPLEAAVPLARSISTPQLRIATNPSARSPSGPRVVAHNGRTVELDSPPFIVPGPLAEDLEVPPPSGDLPRVSTDLPRPLSSDIPRMTSSPEPTPFESPDHTPPYDPFLQPDPYYSNLVDEEFDGLLPKSAVQQGSGFSQDVSPLWSEGTPSGQLESLTPRALPGQVLSSLDPSSTSRPLATDAPPGRIVTREGPLPTPPGQRFVSRDLPTQTTPRGGQRITSLDVEAEPFPQPQRFVSRDLPMQATPVNLMAPALSSSAITPTLPVPHRTEWWQRLGPLLVVLSLILSLIALAAALLVPHFGEPDPRGRPAIEKTAPAPEPK